jgi:1-acyl-sn-glycerol-3-phosphate acyltransferase
MSHLIGAWRLLRVVFHVFIGMAVLGLLFPRRDAVGRQWHIQRWSAGLLRCLGLQLTVQQQAPVAPAALVVLNHVSWLDIACVHAALPQARFVSKADVRHWPLIGWMVAAAGTLFIERERKRDALRVVHHCAEALRAGDTVAVFPEGTTGPGPELLPFHANLLQAAVSVDAPLQPLALRFHVPGERFASAAAYVGDTHLLTSLWRVASARSLRAELKILAPIETQAMERRALSDLARQRIQEAL